MATTTPNYGWSVPTSSDLVKNGATAIETLGDSVDDSLWNVGFGQAGKNKIINGDFSIWQRGISFSPALSDTYCADRWFQNSGNNTDNYITRQTFTPATAPVAGYENAYYLRYVTTPAGSGGTFKNLTQRIEDVRVFAGQTATLSFWAKADAARDVVTSLQQNFGSGGSSSVSVTGATHTLTTLWARYSVTFPVPSITGKTIGTSSYLRVNFSLPLNTAMTIEFFGVQLEYGSKMTPFQTASGGSPQSELAMCQRYYWRNTTGATYGYFTTGYADSTTTSRFYIQYPVTMRTIPTALDYSSNIMIEATPGAGLTPSTITLISGTTGTSGTAVSANFASGLTQYRPYALLANNSTTAYLGFTAEL